MLARMLTERRLSTTLLILDHADYGFDLIAWQVLGKSHDPALGTKHAGRAAKLQHPDWPALRY
jgi:hypothetical protein